MSIFLDPFNPGSVVEREKMEPYQCIMAPADNPFAPMTITWAEREKYHNAVIRAASLVAHVELLTAQVLSLQAQITELGAEVVGGPGVVQAPKFAITTRPTFGAVQVVEPAEQAEPEKPVAKPPKPPKSGK